MTITPVLGTALIRAAALQKKVRGPLFVLREALVERLSRAFQSKRLAGTGLVSLNWLVAEWG